MLASDQLRLPSVRWRRVRLFLTPPVNFACRRPIYGRIFCLCACVSVNRARAVCRLRLSVRQTVQCAVAADCLGRKPMNCSMAALARRWTAEVSEGHSSTGRSDVTDRSDDCFGALGRPNIYKNKEKCVLAVEKSVAVGGRDMAREITARATLLGRHDRTGRDGHTERADRVHTPRLWAPALVKRRSYGPADDLRLTERPEGDCPDVNHHFTMATHEKESVFSPLPVPLFRFSNE